MKFWKAIVTIATFCLTISAIVVYTACTKDPCQNVTCYNGGSCNGGGCVCPTPFQGPTCSERVIDRYIGYYAGFTGCNSGAQLIDTVFIEQYTPKDNLKVAIRQKTHPNVILIGTVSSNESTYSISIPDSIATGYTKSFHITLQSDKSLTLYSYERDTTTPGVSIVNQCNFVGTKQR